MAKVLRSSFTANGVPPFNTTVLFSDPTFLADEIEFSIGPSSGTVSSHCHSGTGLATPTQQTAKAVVYGDSSTGGKTEQVNNKCVLHYRLVSGALTKVVQGSMVSMATPGEFTINFDTLPSSHLIYLVARQY